MDYNEIKKALNDNDRQEYFNLNNAFMDYPLGGSEFDDLLEGHQRPTPSKPSRIPGRLRKPFDIANADDRVNSPSHYTRGGREAIDTIEDAIQDAPNVTVGMLHAQVLKYLLRLWLKDNTLEDAKKAQWYLDRLISKLQ